MVHIQYIGLENILDIVAQTAIIMLHTGKKRSRGSSVSMVIDYGLDDRGSILDRGRGFLF
jgi:hypothetical protein